MIFLNLVETEDPTDAWCTPPKNFSSSEEEKSTSLSIAKRSMNQLDSLLSRLKTQKMMRILASYLEKMLQIDDWKYSFGALMALSQSLEYLENPKNDLNEILQLLHKFVPNSHPKVLYACCHVIGLICEDMDIKEGNNFQNIYGLLSVLSQHSVPRVRSYAFAALCNLFDNSNSAVKIKYFNEAYQKLLGAIQNNITDEIENAILCFASFFDKENTEIMLHHEEIITFLLTKIESFPMNQHLRVTHYFVETLTILMEISSKMQVHRFYDKTMETILTFYSQNSSHSITEHLDWIFPSFSRLGNVDKTKFGTHFEKIINFLFSHFLHFEYPKLLEKNDFSKLDIDKNCADSINSVMSNFANLDKVLLGKHLRKLIWIQLLLIKKLNSSKPIDTLQEFCEVFKFFDCPPIKNKKILLFGQNILFGNKLEIALELIQILNEALRLEIRFDVLKSYGSCFKTILKHVGGEFQKNEIFSLYAQLKLYYAKGNELKKSYYDDYILEGVVTNISEEKENLESEFEEFSIHIAESIGSIVKFTDEPQLIEDVVKEFELLTLDLQDSVKSNLFKIFIICDLLEFISQKLPTKMLIHFEKSIRTLLVNNIDPELTNAAAFALGLLAISQKGYFIEHHLEFYWKLISGKYLQSWKEGNRHINEFVKDNFLSSAGKILIIFQQTIKAKDINCQHLFLAQKPTQISALSLGNLENQQTNIASQTNLSTQQKTLFNLFSDWTRFLPVTSDLEEFEGVSENLLSLCQTLFQRILQMSETQMKVFLKVVVQTKLRLPDLLQQYTISNTSFDHLNNRLDNLSHKLFNSESIASLIQQNSWSIKEKKYFDSIMHEKSASSGLTSIIQQL